MDIFMNIAPESIRTTTWGIFILLVLFSLVVQLLVFILRQPFKYIKDNKKRSKVFAVSTGITMFSAAILYLLKTDTFSLEKLLVALFIPIFFYIIYKLSDWLPNNIMMTEVPKDHNLKEQTGKKIGIVRCPRCQKLTINSTDVYRIIQTCGECNIKVKGFVNNKLQNYFLAISLLILIICIFCIYLKTLSFHEASYLFLLLFFPSLIIYLYIYTKTSKIKVVLNDRT